MAFRRSDQERREALDAYQRYGSITAAATALGIPRTTFESRVHDAWANPPVGSAPAEDPTERGILRAEITRLKAELSSTQHDAITNATIKRLIIGLVQEVDRTSSPEWAMPERHEPSSPGVPTLFLSDLHWGEVVKPEQINGVNEYSLEIAHERMRALVQGTIKLLSVISPTMDYPGLVLALGGDNISGNIHEELMATNQLNTMPTILDLYGVMIWAIDEFLKVFKRIFIPCVGGNHGRDTMKTWAKDRNHTSFDWLLYCLLAKHFEKDERVTFLIPDGPDAYYKVFEHRFLLTHGDQFRGGDGVIGALGPIIRGDHRKRSRNAQIDMAYDTLMIGHWHQHIHLTRLIVNGSLKGYDEYAWSNNFGYEPPQQALWINHPKHGITFRMPVHVEEIKTLGPANWVSLAA